MYAITILILRLNFFLALYILVISDNADFDT